MSLLFSLKLTLLLCCSPLAKNVGETVTKSRTHIKKAGHIVKECRTSCLNVTKMQLTVLDCVI